jgi:thiamine biosynthesis protein ThiI
MYRIASEIAVKERAEGIVTGESLGQVASQTLNNLTVLTEASPLPIYRPLIGFDKNEIEEVAAKIGIRDIAAIKMKGCKAAPKKPATKSNIELIKETEKKLNITELVKNAVEGIRIIEM